MEKINVSMEIEKLLQFALKHKLIQESDVILSRNSLMDLLEISEPYNGTIEEENFSSPHEILQNILEYAAEKGLTEDNTITSRDLFDTKIMGILMPRQSEVIRDFYDIYKDEGPAAATHKYYAFSQASNYIRKDRIMKNLYWKTATEYGNLEITINLSKPEKEPKEIAALKLVPQVSYPKCLLCIENVGYSGSKNRPARQNHRVIPVKLGEEQWYFQYSPYVYYNEHCILFYEKHVPMKISDKTFVRLFDFIERFPHYFIGSNADLPIVGGSILSHEHFQGGRHVFPMEEAPAEYHFLNNDYNDVNAAIVKWPLSVIRLSSQNRNEITELSSKIFKAWKCYSDPKLQILAYSDQNGIKISHNTITPIARKNKNGEFEMDLVLRNNRTNDKYPDGIFHPHKELHHIKKENIGLIEVMGLAVLPARLNTELKEIKKILEGNLKIMEDSYEDPDNIIYKHLPWIKELIKKYGTQCTCSMADEIIKNEVGYKFLDVLMDAGVYKRDKEGLEGFKKFLHYINFKDVLS